MDERELIKKMNEYLQQQPRGKKITYSQIANAIEAPYATDHLKRVARRSDSPYYRTVIGGIKTIGKGDKKMQSARGAALMQRRGFLRRIFERDPQATMRPALGFTKEGDMQLGQHDVLQDGKLTDKSTLSPAQPSSQTQSSPPPTRPDIDLAI